MAVERRQAERTSFVMARESATAGSPVTEIENLVKIKGQQNKGKYRRYVVTAWNHDENSEKQSSNALRAGRADVFGEDGFLWGDGTIEIEIPSEEGFLDILQGVLGDPKPVSTELSEKTLISSETALNAIKANGFFTDARNPDPNAPGRLEFTLKAAENEGRIIVSGVRKVGLASTDTLPLREVIDLNNTTKFTTSKYFHKILDVDIQKKDGSASTQPVTSLKSIPGGYSTVLKTVNDEFQGWTLEPEIGGEPWVVTRAVPIGAEIEVGESISATIDLLSNRVDKRRTIAGGEKDQFTPTPLIAANKNKFAFVGRRFFSGYGRYLVIDGEAVICDGAPISIAHNYDFAQGKVPGRFRRGTEATARRNVTSSVQTKYESGTAEEDTFIKWDEKFRNNESVSVEIGMYQWLGNGRQLSITYKMSNCEIVSPVRVPVTGPGAIPVTVELKAVPPVGQVAGELEVTIVGDDQWS